MIGSNKRIFWLFGLIQVIEDPAYVLKDEVVVLVPLGTHPGMFLIQRKRR